MGSRLMIARLIVMRAVSTAAAEKPVLTALAPTPAMPIGPATLLKSAAPRAML